MVPNAYEIAINKGIGRKASVREILADVLDVMARNRSMTRFATASNIATGTLHHLRRHPEQSPNLITVEKIFEGMGYKLTLEAIR